MTIHRFHCTDLTQTTGLSEPVAQLDRDESKHAVSVLRLEVGDDVELFDGQGTEAVGQVLTRAKSGVTIAISESRRVAPPQTSIDIVAAIPKGPRSDSMIQQLSQVGVDRLIPLISERAIVNPRETKLEKFRRAAVESAKQCRRAHVLQIADPEEMTSALACNAECKLIADARGMSMGDLTPESPKSVRVLIGPEGGFSAKEQSAAAEAGFVQWSLGTHIMRIETAAVVAGAFLRHITEGADP